MMFSVLCSLLVSLEKIITRHPRLPARQEQAKVREAIANWAAANRALLDTSTSTLIPIISALFPEERPDRVYGLQAPSLSRVIARCLMLPSTRIHDMGRWKQPGFGDLADCVERTMKMAENEAPMVEVTVEEVDAALDFIAGRCRFSGNAIRKTRGSISVEAVNSALSKLYLRLSSKDAKFLTRMILKSHFPIILPKDFTFACIHQLLPKILQVRGKIQAAIKEMSGPELSGMKASTNNNECRTQLKLAALNFKPEIDTKIGRPTFLKARGIRHALSLAHGRRMTLERKYDGEYCQIHINLSKPGNEIRIFSKSGKESTMDRQGVHQAITDALRFGKPDSLVKQRCILEGELLVWSEKDMTILPFHKIRKHVSRCGSFIGTARDSQPHHWERLMIVFFDVLLIDDSSLLNHTYIDRQRRLKEMVQTRIGSAELAEKSLINFGNNDASDHLAESLASCFSKAWEGLVMKPCDEPYIDFEPYHAGSYRSCWIKLKKDYILGLGDTAELAIVGAGYDANSGPNRCADFIPWTHFHIGLLTNRREFDVASKPHFKVIDAFNFSIRPTQFKQLWQAGQARAIPFKLENAACPFEIELESGLASKMDVVFKEPFVFEVMGSGFDKPPNRDHFLLRFPRLVKIHWDKTYLEAVDFDELQALADTAMYGPQEDLSQDVARWQQRVVASEAKGAYSKRTELSQYAETIRASSDGEDEEGFATTSPRIRRTMTAAGTRKDILDDIHSVPSFLRTATAPPQAIPAEEPRKTEAAHHVSEHLPCKIEVTELISPARSRSCKKRSLESLEIQSEASSAKRARGVATPRDHRLTTFKHRSPLREIFNTSPRVKKRPVAKSVRSLRCRTTMINDKGESDVLIAGVALKPTLSTLSTSNVSDAAVNTYSHTAKLEGKDLVAHQLQPSPRIDDPSERLVKFKFGTSIKTALSPQQNHLLQRFFFSRLITIQSECPSSVTLFVDTRNEELSGMDLRRLKKDVNHVQKYKMIEIWDVRGALDRARGRPDDLTKARCQPVAQALWEAGLAGVSANKEHIGIGRVVIKSSYFKEDG
ncbi:hypothetical protein MMC25_008006 [Agyrium rufum]|nr:hypothetical protein [Agyrium rufum]